MSQRNHKERSVLQEAEATLDGVLIAHNTHDAGGFVACFAHDGVLRIVPTGDAVYGREQIQVFLEAESQAFLTACEPHDVNADAHDVNADV